MFDYPKVSVIIPMHNAVEYIKSCVNSVISLDYPNFETIVVDDASTDSSASLVSNLPCKLITLEKNSGAGVARNEGVKFSSGEILAFTDADCKVPEDWLKIIIQDFKKHNISAVSGGYSESLNRGLIALFQFYDTNFRQRNIPQYINSCITSNFACKRQVFEQVGGFPLLRFNEDMEFAFALSKKTKIFWDKNNDVAHNFSNNLRNYFIKQILWSESVVKLYLSAPDSISKKNTYRNSEIFLHLLFTSCLYLCLFIIFWKLWFIVLLFALLIVYYIVNIKFIESVAKKEGYFLAVKIFPFLLVRNTAWLVGIISAIFQHILRLCHATILAFFTKGNK